MFYHSIRDYITRKLRFSRAPTAGASKSIARAAHYFLQLEIEKGEKNRIDIANIGNVKQDGG